MAETRRVPHLPEEMIFEILSFLPVLSILPCKLVCKLWESIISSTKFVEAHLTNLYQKQQFLPSSVLVDVHGNKDREIYWVDSNEDIRKFKLPQKFNGTTRFVDSCNGLVIFANSCADVIYLWNPMIKRSKILPTPKIKAYWIGNIGFGFDSISNDYKVLRIALTKGSSNLLSVSEVEVYSANADSWKEIRVPKIFENIYFYPENCVHAQPGVLYLEGSDSELLSFDLHTERFRIHPYFSPERYGIVSNVFDFEGSIGMVFKSFVDGSAVFSLWTVDSVCGKVFWNKKFELETDWEIDHVYHYSGAGQFVAVNYDVGYICYDYIKKKTKKFPLSASLFTHLNKVIKYTESLVSLKGFEKLD